MKKNILIIAVALTIGCVVLVFLSGQKFSKSQEELDVERYNRMVAEEKLSKALLRIKLIESKFTKKESELGEALTLLDQERSISENRKAQLEKILKVNEELELALKNAINRDPSVEVNVEPE